MNTEEMANALRNGEEISTNNNFNTIEEAIEAVQKLRIFIHEGDDGKSSLRIYANTAETDKDGTQINLITFNGGQTFHRAYVKDKSPKDNTKKAANQFG